jgi:hypothetical protein
MWWPGCPLDIKVDAGIPWYGENLWSGFESILAVLVDSWKVGRVVGGIDGEY